MTTKGLRDAASVKGVFQEERYDPVVIGQAQAIERQKQAKKDQEDLMATCVEFSKNTADSWRDLNSGLQSIYGKMSELAVAMRKAGVDKTTVGLYMNNIIPQFVQVGKTGKADQEYIDKVMERSQVQTDKRGRKHNNAGADEYIRRVSGANYNDLDDKKKEVFRKQMPKEIIDMWDKGLIDLTPAMDVLVRHEEIQNQPKWYIREDIRIPDEIKKIMDVYKADTQTMNTYTGTWYGTKTEGQNFTEENKDKANYEIINSPFIREQMIADMTNHALNDSEESEEAMYKVGDMNVYGYTDKKTGEFKTITDQQIDEEIKKKIPEIVKKESVSISRTPTGGGGGGWGDAEEASGIIPVKITSVTSTTTKNEDGTEGNPVRETKVSTYDGFELRQTQFATNSDYVTASSDSPVAEGQVSYYYKPTTIAALPVAKKDLSHQYRSAKKDFWVDRDGIFVGDSKSKDTDKLVKKGEKVNFAKSEYTVLNTKKVKKGGIIHSDFYDYWNESDYEYKLKFLGIKSNQVVETDEDKKEPVIIPLNAQTERAHIKQLTPPQRKAFYQDLNQLKNKYTIQYTPATEGAPIEGESEADEYGIN